MFFLLVYTVQCIVYTKMLPTPGNFSDFSSNSMPDKLNFCCQRNRNEEKWHVVNYAEESEE